MGAKRTAAPPISPGAHVTFGMGPPNAAASLRAMIRPPGALRTKCPDYWGDVDLTNV